MTATTRSAALAAACLALLLCLCAPVAELSAQATGVLTGLVTDENTGRAIVGAVVVHTTAGLTARTDSTGYFAMQGVPLGSGSVRLEAPGYVSVTSELEVSEVEFLQVRLMAVAAALDEIVVLAGRTPGRARRVEVDENEQPSRTVMDLLGDRIPGVTVHRGGGNIGGGGAAITIRGVSTLQGATAPDVYLDGVRLDGRDTGEHAMHILDRIPASEVARVRVLKGPEAAAYPFSANGVIVIETHSGGGSTPRE